MSSELASVGSRNEFACSIPVTSSQNIVKCNIKTPNNEVWEVVGGQVVDNSSAVVPGYAGVDNGNPLKTCGIRIASVQITDIGKKEAKKYVLRRYSFALKYQKHFEGLQISSDYILTIKVVSISIMFICMFDAELFYKICLGDWTCILMRDSGATNTVRGTINLRESGYVPNVRLPNNVQPNAYFVDIIVTLEPDFVTEGTFSINTIVTRDGQHDGFIFLNFG